MRFNDDPQNERSKPEGFENLSLADKEAFLRGEQIETEQTPTEIPAEPPPEQVSEQIEKIETKGKELGVQVLFDINESVPGDKKEIIHKETLEFLESLNDEEKLKLKEIGDILIENLENLNEIRDKIKRKEEIVPEIEPMIAVEPTPTPTPTPEPEPVPEQKEPVAEILTVPETSGQPSKWGELCNLLSGLNIDLEEVNKEQLEGFQKTNPDRLEEKSGEIKEAIESFSGKNLLREKFYTIKLIYPPYPIPRQIFIEDNILRIDLSINKQEITDFLNNLFKPEDKKEETAPEPAPVTLENNELTLEIGKCQNFEELYEVLKKAGGIQGSLEFFSADTLIPGIEFFRKWVDGLEYITDIWTYNRFLGQITRSNGLRDKVEELCDSKKKLKTEEGSKQEPIPAVEPVAPVETPAAPIPEQEKAQSDDWKESEEWKKFEEVRDELARFEASSRYTILASSGLELKRDQYSKYRVEVAEKIKESIRKRYGESLLPLQQDKFNAEVHDTQFKELVKKENDAYDDALRANREKTWKDVMKIEAAKVLRNKIIRWYVGQNKWTRLGINTALYSVAIGIGTFATGGAATAAMGAGVYRATRGVASFGGATAGHIIGNEGIDIEIKGKKIKIWKQEELNKWENEETEKIKRSTDSLEEKSRKLREITEEVAKQRKKIAAYKTVLTVGLGAGAGVAAGGLLDSYYGADNPTLEPASDTKIGVSADHTRGPEAEITEPQPVKAPAPKPVPKTAPIEETLAQKPPASAENLFSDPSVLKHEVVAGDSTWKILNDTLENNGQFKGMTEAQKSYVLSALTNKVLEDPGSYGIGKDGILSVTDKTDLTKLFEDTKEINSIFNKAVKTITEGSTQEKLILANNEKIANWVANHKNEPLTNEQVVDILNTKPRPEIFEKMGITPAEIEPIKSPISETLTEPDILPKADHVEPVKSVLPETLNNELPELPELAKPLTAGVITMSVLERDRMKEAKKFSERINNSRNPSIERTFPGDLQQAKVTTKLEADVEKALTDDVNHFFSERNSFGFKIKGVNSPKWNFIKGLSFSKLVKYYRGDSNESGLNLDVMEELKKSEKYGNFVNHVVGLKDQADGTIFSFEKDDSIEKVLRKVGRYLLEHPPVQLKKAA